MSIDSKIRKNKIRVLVADDSRIHTRLVADALKSDPLFEVIAFDAALSNLISAVIGVDSDVLVISANLNEQTSRGLEILRGLRSVAPNVRAVVLMDSLKDEVVLDAFRAGARGIFAKSQPIELLCKCVRSVHQGQIWAGSREMSLAVEALASTPTVRAVNARGLSLLSKRELQIVRCLAEGLCNREIAERLKLSRHTVKNHLFRVFDKLGVSSRIELLFMTLSQASAEQASLQWASKGDHNGDGSSEAEFDLLKKPAERVLPVAQLTLAEVFLARRRDPQDLVEAYMWYLVGTECALQTRDFITEKMTPEQLEEAKQKANIWLSRLKRTSLSSAGPSR